MGFEIHGNFDHISRATTTGIQSVYQPSFIDFADVITGATMRATTAGRMPRNIDDTT